MRIAIDLDDQPGWEADEVDYVVANDVLAAKLETCQPFRSQDRPYSSFGWGGVRSQLLSSLEHELIARHVRMVALT
jgi:hypothetical protein